MGEGVLDTAVIAGAFDILESEVIKAWKYWDKKGVIKLSKQGDGYEIEFLKLSRTDEAKAEIVATVEQKAEKIISVEHKPSYTPDEINILIGEDKELEGLLIACQGIMSKTLTANDVAVIVEFYDWLKLKPEVITILIAQYCDRSMRYIEKIAIDWAEKGISNSEQAEYQINSVNKDYNAILRCFGVRGRGTTEEEQKYITAWLKDMQMPLEVIKLACKTAVHNTGQVSFNYADAIIKDWHEKKIDTVEAAQADSEKFRNQLKEKPQTAPKKSKAKGKEQISYNEDKLKELEKRLLGKK